MPWSTIQDAANTCGAQTWFLCCPNLWPCVQMALCLLISWSDSSGYFICRRWQASTSVYGQTAQSWRNTLCYTTSTFGIVLLISVLCATLHLALFTDNYLGRKKKYRGKEDTKLLLSSRMTGYNSSSTWQTTDTRGKVKMIQGYTNAWRYFPCR